MTPLTFGEGDGKLSNTWPQWRGPNRDSVSRESISTWPPLKLWQTNVGQGVSSVIVHRGHAFAVSHREGKDLVYGFDTATGRVLWQQSYTARSDQTTDVTLPGPRATPATDGERLFVLSLEGHLRCLSNDTGQMLWSKTPPELSANIGQSTAYAVPRCSMAMFSSAISTASVSRSTRLRDQSFGEPQAGAGTAPGQ